MAFQILLNVVLALVWMFLSHSYNPSSFIVGYLLGILLLLGFRKFFNSRFYMQRVWAVIKLFFLFIKELIMANISVLKVILKPKLDMKPGIFALETELKNPWEITLLANLITLTPGTLVIDVSDDNKVLYIHAMDINDVQSDIDAIKNSFEKAIMEVSR
ncbi:Na+/H+ antiporter subunit E [Bacillus sp. AGMB 02131]|uniref:Na+/H+ antiporter subunit E n=1 Tax=Peribacillus faecalis TaxID=2772559 RepID=A0A927HBI9_9BACI|nr:Na+/H+ antiporter subunit E [Peribacillus faecalis]MBD3109029.1 Na+/H+ antiporter subunit E [Peribacillus faecalis]